MVDEGKERLQSSRNDNSGRHRKREEENKLLCGPPPVCLRVVRPDVIRKDVRADVQNVRDKRTHHDLE